MLGHFPINQQVVYTFSEKNQINIYPQLNNGKMSVEPVVADLKVSLNSKFGPHVQLYLHVL
jgi:hypothetical protein